MVGKLSVYHPPQLIISRQACANRLGSEIDRYRSEITKTHADGTDRPGADTIPSGCNQSRSTYLTYEYLLYDSPARHSTKLNSPSIVITRVGLRTGEHPALLSHSSKHLHHLDIRKSSGRQSQILLVFGLVFSRAPL